MQKKDQKSFEKLYDFFYPQIMLYVTTKIPLIEVENLVANIWLIIIDKINDYRFNKKMPFAVWVFHIVHNEITYFYRRKKIAFGVDISSKKEQDNSWENLPDDLVLPELNSFFDDEKDAKNHQEISKLPAEQRTIMELNLTLNFSPIEIAAIMDKTEKYICTQQVRAWQILRNIYEIQKNITKISCLNFFLKLGYLKKIEK
jgi:RNA polymerase sigma factor (sigma-70 family)